MTRRDGRTVRGDGKTRCRDCDAVVAGGTERCGDCASRWRGETARAGVARALVALELPQMPPRTCPECPSGEYIGRQEGRDFFDCGHTAPATDGPVFCGPVRREKPAPPRPINGSRRPRPRRRGRK